MGRHTAEFSDELATDPNLEILPVGKAEADFSNTPTCIEMEPESFVVVTVEEEVPLAQDPFEQADSTV